MTLAARRGVLAAMLTVLTVVVPPAAATDDPTIRTIAGGALQGADAAGLTIRPAGVAFEADGDVLVTDAGNDLLWRITPEGSASVVAGDARPCLVVLSQPNGADCHRAGAGDDGPARDAHLVAPTSVAVAPGGDIFVAEPQADDVRRIDAATGTITTALGTGETAYAPSSEGAPGPSVAVHDPASLEVDAEGNLYVADVGNRLVRRLGADGNVHTVLGCTSGCSDSLRDGSRLEGTTIPTLRGVTIGPDGTLYVATAVAVFRVDEVEGRYRRIAGDTFAGATRPGEGDGGPARDAKLSDISDVAFGPDGRLYVLDRAWSRIRAIESPGVPGSTIEHVAGTAHGFGGDGGAAVKAAFNVASETARPGQIALSADGALAIGDVGNARLRIVDPSGVITTAAGTGVTAPATRLYQANDLQPASAGVRGGFSGDGGLAARAQLWGPSDVAVDEDGTIYVVDAYAHRVRRIHPDGTIETVAGTGCAGLGCTHNGLPLGDEGPATQAHLNHPVSVHLDDAREQLYIADRLSYRVRQVNLGASPVTVYPQALGGDPITIQPGHIATVFGSGGRCLNILPDCGDGRFATQATAAYVSGLAVDAGGSLYLTDVDAHLVRRVDGATGAVRSVVGVPFWSDCDGRGREGVPGAATLLCGPTDLAIGPDGALYVAETGVYGFGSGIISDDSAPRVRRVDLADPLARSTVVVGTGGAGYGGDGGPAREATLTHVGDLAFGPDGSLYVADTGNHRVRRVGADGTIVTIAGHGAAEGTIEFFGGFSLTGAPGCSHLGDGGPASLAGLCAPLGIAIDGDRLVIADQLNNRIRAVDGV